MYGDYIENISDQISGFAREAADATKKISEQYGFSYDVAARVVQAGAMAMAADGLHHIFLSMNENVLGRDIKEAADTIWHGLATVADALEKKK